MQFIVHMKLESDTIFGNGMNVPGGEDISVQTDSWGFPYLKGSTFKGIFREEFINYLAWERKSAEEAEETVKVLLQNGASVDLIKKSFPTLSVEYIEKIDQQLSVVGQ